MTSAMMLTYFARLLVLFTMLPIHEYAHGWVADKLGDPTARHLGRLDLNPLVHLDLMGGILLFFTGFGWAKPIPVNGYNFKRQYTIRGGFALTALAGPVANVLMALVVMIIYKGVLAFGLAAQVGSQSIVILLQLLHLVISINLGLAVFNLLPVPPLDGYKVLSYFLPTNVLIYVQQNQQVFFIVLMVLVWMTGIVSSLIGLVSGWLYQLLNQLTFFMDVLIKFIP